MSQKREVSVEVKTVKYDKDEENDFQNKVMSRKFRNCKLILVGHLEKDTHSLQLTKNDSMEKVRVKEEKRNTMVGLTLERIVYHLGSFS